MTRVVVDTNVFVSSILSPRNLSAQILDLILSQRLKLLVADGILKEYQEVLQREEFSFNPETVQDLLRFIQMYAEKVTLSPSKISLSDASDEPFLACALQGKADFLMTGNKKHFPPALCRPVAVVSPAEFLEILKERNL